MKKALDNGTLYALLIVAALTVVALLTGCSTEKMNAHSRGYSNPTNYHKSPARTSSGPNSGVYYKR